MANLITQEVLQAGRDNLRCAGRQVGPRGLANHAQWEAWQVGRIFRGASGGPESETCFNEPEVHEYTGSPIQILVRQIDGQEQHLICYSESKVHMLKSELASKLGVALARVKLVHDTVVLQSNQTVGDSHLDDGAAVTLLVMPPLYEGTKVYEKIAEAFSASQEERPSEEQVQEHMAEVMEKRVALHDALQGNGLLKKRF